MESVRKRLQEAMEIRGKRQQDLIDEFGFRSSTLSYYLSGDRPNQVTNYFNRIVSAMPDVHYFRYQDFRGFAASYMIQQGLGLVSTTKDSGWTSTRTADKHYFQSIRDIEDEQREKLIKSYDYFRQSK